jgi:hypothetical protein
LHHYTVRPFLRHFGKRRFELISAADHHNRIDFDARRMARYLNLFEYLFVGRVGSVSKRGHTLHRRQHVPKHFDTFPVRLRNHIRQAGDVATRSRQACNQTCSDRVACEENNGNGGGSRLRRKSGRRGERNNDSYVLLDEFIRHGWQLIESTLGPAKFDYDIPPFAVAYLSQAFTERRY